MTRFAIIAVLFISFGIFLPEFDACGQTNSEKGFLKENPQNKHIPDSVNCFKLGVGDLAAWAEAVAAIANLVLVIFIFNATNKQHTLERNQDFKNRETERKAEVAGFWIEELIMRQHHAMIHKFFDDFETRLNQPAIPVDQLNHVELLKRASQEILNFKQQLHRIDQLVINPLQWIHQDFMGLTDIRNEIEDLVTNELGKIPGIAQQAANVTNPEHRLAELRRRFFQTIHQIQTKVILNSTHELDSPPLKSHLLPIA